MVFLNATKSKIYIVGKNKANFKNRENNKLYQPYYFFNKYRQN